MCEITCENFYSELPAIETALEECAFVSLDMEFSKIHENIANPFTFFDTPEERYIKLRHKISDITCIQLGLAIFIYDANKKTFKTCTYSFYTYPQTFYKSDSVVNFETACVEFLCKHKFDFNKLFNSRVPYLTDEQEFKMKSEMMDEYFFDKYFETNFKFRSIEEELIKILNIVSDWYDNANYGDETFLEINGCNEPAYIILMQYYLLKKLKYIIIVENQLGLNVTKVEKQENSEILNNQIYERLKQSLLDKMMGIKYLIKLLSKLKKPLIGHNCALDIFILCNQFFKPIPENFKDFRNFISKNFGPIYDTKLLSKEVKRIMPKNDEWLGNSLSEIYSYFHDGYAKLYSDGIQIELTSIKEPQNMKLHDAGWDAYYTGYCFVKMVYIIKNSSDKIEKFDQRYTLTELFKAIEYYKYKLYTCRSITNSINLGTDDNINMSNSLIIQNKGVFHKALDLKKLKYDLKQFSYFDMKLLSKYTAMIITPIRNDRFIEKIKPKYMVENYSEYRSRKKKQYIFSLLIISTSLTMIIYLKNNK